MHRLRTTLFFFSVLAVLTASCTTIAVATGKPIPENQSAEIQQKIHEFFPDVEVASIMIAIATCESTGLIHWGTDGKLLPNSYGNSSAAGVFQILLYTHRKKIKEMGLDMSNIDHYMTFVRHLYDMEKYNPWRASKHCWGS